MKQIKNPLKQFLDMLKTMLLLEEKQKQNGGEFFCFIIFVLGAHI